MMKYVREAGLRNINQSHTAEGTVSNTADSIKPQPHVHGCFLHLNFQKCLRTKVNMWAQVSSGEHTEGLKDMR